MVSNLRIQPRVFCFLMLSLIFISNQSRAADSEAYRRQAKQEIERANDFHRFQKFLHQFEQNRMSGVPEYKKEQKREIASYKKAREIYSVWRKREDAKKPTDEFIEKMLAQKEAKEEREKEAIRKEYRTVQMEIERAIKNSRLDEAEEFGLDR